MWQSPTVKERVQMEKIKLQPLSRQEQTFAENNHNLVYSFLYKHRYSIEEYYNVVIFGYLKAVQIYHRREDLRKKYDFPFICWQYMRSEIKDYHRGEDAKKRQPVEIIISLDAEYAESEDIYNCMGGKSVEDELMETAELLELLENFSEQQKDILKLKLDGYSNKDICALLEIQASSFYYQMNRIKAILEDLRGGK